MVESQEELKNLLMRVKEDSEKAGLKLKLQRTNIMTSGPITSWQMWGKSGSSRRLYILGPQNHCMMTAAMKLKDACSLEKKAITNLNSLLKSRDITLLTKICIVKALVFPVVMYRCESLTINSEH